MGQKPTVSTDVDGSATLSWAEVEVISDALTKVRNHLLDGRCADCLGYVQGALGLLGTHGGRD